MSDEYVAGQASAEDLAKLEALRQAASSEKSPVFDANNPNGRMLFFAFDGAGSNEDALRVAANLCTRRVGA